MSSKVDVFIVGAQKAGTTSLYEWLGQHPDIEAPLEIKDYHFFTNNNLFNKGIKHFDGFYKQNKPISMHCAVNYLYFHSEAASRIHKYNPDAKIIICLREPVARAISAYKYNVKTLRESRVFSNALEVELSGKLISHLDRADYTYIGHGRYLEQIISYKNLFPASQIHYVFFEDIFNEEKRDREMKKIINFLSLPISSMNFNYRHLNKSGKPRSNTINFMIRKSFIRRWAATVLPMALRKRVVSFLLELNTSSHKIDLNIRENDVATLRKELNLSRERLGAEIGRNVCNIWK